MTQPAPLLQVLFEADENAAAASLTLGEDAETARTQRLATVEHLAGIDRLAKRLQVIGENRERIKASWATFEADVMDGSPHEDINAVIDAMLGLEETVKEGLQVAAEERADRARAFTLPAATKRERARRIAVLERMATVYKEVYEDIQAKRLWAMAKRAELEDSGAAPVFDDFDELVKYLDDDSR